MSVVTLLIPIRTTSRNGFFNHDGAPKQLFGYDLHMKIEKPYQYLELHGLPSEHASEVLKKVRALLPWAAVRLNFGILSGEGELKFEDRAAIDGQFATAYPQNLAPRLMRIEAGHKTEEPDARLFSALIEGSQLSALIGPDSRKEFILASELFAFVDFEASANAQFLALISILEILAKPAPRPPQCIDIIDDAMAHMMREAQIVQDSALRQALKDMYHAASHWKAESIRSSIRRLGTSVSQALGDTDCEEAGRKAVRLYDKRSKVVHEGETVSLDDVAKTRQIVREAVAVEAGCFHHIRERYPTN